MQRSRRRSITSARLIGTSRILIAVVGKAAPPHDNRAASGKHIDIVTVRSNYLVSGLDGKSRIQILGLLLMTIGAGEGIVFEIPGVATLGTSEPERVKVDHHETAMRSRLAVRMYQIGTPVIAGSAVDRVLLPVTHCGFLLVVKSSCR